MQIDSDMIIQFGLKCLGIFTLIFLGALITPKLAEYIDQWKSKHSEKSSVKHPQTKQEYSVRSIYELPPEPRKKAHVRKKIKKK